MDCLTGKASNLAKISASSAMHVKPLCRNTIPISWPKFHPQAYVICIPWVLIWPNNNSGRDFGQKNAKRRVDTPESLALRGRTDTTVTNTAAHRNQSPSWVSTPFYSASSKASKEGTLFAAQSISWSPSQESMAMEECSGAAACTTRGCTQGVLGGSGSGLGGWLWGQGNPTRSSRRCTVGNAD